MARFGLVGLYVGVVPIVLGLLWFPLLQRLGRRGMAFVLTLTIGLLAFLVADMWGEAQEVGATVAGSFHAPVLIPVLALLTVPLLVTVGNVLKRRSREPASSPAVCGSPIRSRSASACTISAKDWRSAARLRLEKPRSAFS